MGAYQIRFIDKILDNVHGFIEFTQVEREIIELPIFKRLQGIKQLGLTNWIFPGAEHTRFIHALGVMHIADQMAVQLNYTDEERQLARLAGLLHDIGHYPLSHVGERAYKNLWGKPQGERPDLLVEQRAAVQKALGSLDEEPSGYMREASNPFHHEMVTRRVIETDQKIARIIEKHCGGSSIINLANICDIIVGNVEKNERISGLAQLIHSELDADRIDYIMRDATFSGTSYGNFELGLFLRNLSRTDYRGVEIIGVHPKGIAIADQFLVNRYYSYTQIFFNRHVSILEFMAQALTGGFIRMERSEYPSLSGLSGAVERHDGDSGFLYFTDRAFWDSLHHVSMRGKRYLDVFQRMLLNYQEPDLTENREITVTFSDPKELMGRLADHPIYKNLNGSGEDRIPLIYIEGFTRQRPQKDFEAGLTQAAGKKALSEAEAVRLRIRRLQEGIPVLEPGREPVLLCDSPASLMSRLYPTRVCFLREYRLPE